MIICSAIYLRYKYNLLWNGTNYGTKKDVIQILRKMKKKLKLLDLH